MFDLRLDAEKPNKLGRRLQLLCDGNMTKRLEDLIDTSNVTRGLLRSQMGVLRWIRKQTVAPARARRWQDIKRHLFSSVGILTVPIALYHFAAIVNDVGNGAELWQVKKENHWIFTLIMGSVLTIFYWLWAGIERWRGPKER